MIAMASMALSPGHGDSVMVWICQARSTATAAVPSTSARTVVGVKAESMGSR